VPGNRRQRRKLNSALAISGRLAGKTQVSAIIRKVTI
jgi:hypothetical protein